MKKIVLCITILLVVSCGKSTSTDITLSGKNCGSTQVRLSRVIIDELDWHLSSISSNPNEQKNNNAVGQLLIPELFSSCTAFLVNEDTILTNNHCISKSSEAKGAVFKIRLENNEKRTYNCSSFLTTNKILDYSLLKCNGSPGLEHGHVQVSKRVSRTGDQIYLVQENCNYIEKPNCKVEKYTSYGEVTRMKKFILEHNADTLSGSSGSPIFSQDDHQLVALHNAGVEGKSPTSSRNFAVPIGRITKDINNKLPGMKLYFGNSELHKPGATPYQSTPGFSQNCL